MSSCVLKKKQKKKRNNPCPYSCKIQTETQKIKLPESLRGNPSNLIANRMCDTNPKASPHTQTYFETHTSTYH